MYNWESEILLGASESARLTCFLLRDGLEKSRNHKSSVPYQARIKPYQMELQKFTDDKLYGVSGFGVLTVFRASNLKP